jgi:hypothetical protein
VQRVDLIRAFDHLHRVAQPFDGTSGDGNYEESSTTLHNCEDALPLLAPSSA